MDRNRVASTLGSGLVAASIALAVFGLVFFIAVIYIG
jgi:hypothetical protein